MGGRRVIFLGASNLTLSLPLLVQSLRDAVGSGLQLFVADGHGRAFAAPSRFLFTGLPPIADCGLWEALVHLPPASHRPWALVGDVGNDLVYGVAPRSVVPRVGDCLARLQELGTAATLMLPPRVSLEEISASRFYLFRTLFFPASRLSPREALESVAELHERLHELAAVRGTPVIEPRRAWYGFDPVHFRRPCRREAWRTAVEAGEDPDRDSWIEALGTARPSATGAWAVRRCRRSARMRLGRSHRAAQPALCGPGYELHRY